MDLQKSAGQRQGKGKRKHGKKQLRVRESRTWLDMAVRVANEALEANNVEELRKVVAAMMTIILAIRASAVVTRVARDVDDRVTETGEVRAAGLLWTDGKTAAGRVTLVVPEILRPYLLALTKDRLPDTPLFPTKRSNSGLHDRDWPRAQVKRICQLAEVPEVCAHGMRGTAATLAEDYGMAPVAVAKSLGHEDVSTTHRSYSRSRTPARSKHQKALKVLTGGKK